MDHTGKQKAQPETKCESCAYYVCDEDTGLYLCEMSLDEDEMVEFLKGRFDRCPYYKLYDEYAVVRKQN